MDNQTFTQILAALGQVFLLAVFLATINEGLIELLVAPKLQSQWLPYASSFTGILLAVCFNTNLFTPLAVGLGLADGIAVWQWLLMQWGGLVLSGIFIGRGSNYMHQKWPA